jgi:hypothetical protein
MALNGNMKQYFASVWKFRYGIFGINEFILFDAFILLPNMFSHWSSNQCWFGFSGVMSVPVFTTLHFHPPPLLHLQAVGIRWILFYTSSQLNSFNFLKHVA